MHTFMSTSQALRARARIQVASTCLSSSGGRGGASEDSQDEGAYLAWPAGGSNAAEAGGRGAPNV